MKVKELPAKVLKSSWHKNIAVRFSKRKLEKDIAAYKCTDLARGKYFSRNQKILSQFLPKVESMIEIEAMLIAKSEQLTKQELFPSSKPDWEGEEHR